MATQATLAGQMPEDKRAFTWEVLYPLVVDRMVLMTKDLEFCEIIKSVVDGTYDRWPGFKPPV